MVQFTGASAGFAAPDIAVARRFYAETLGLPVADLQLSRDDSDLPWGLRLDLPDCTSVQIYPKADHRPAEFTVLSLQVPDIERAVDELTDRGVAFEHYDEPRTDERGIHRSPHVSPVAWLRDPAGNIVAIVEAG